MKDKYTFKVTYPDGEIEYWYEKVSKIIYELNRLQKISFKTYNKFRRTC